MSVFYRTRNRGAAMQGRLYLFGGLRKSTVTVLRMYEIPIPALDIHM